RDTIGHLKTWLVAADINEGPIFRSVTRKGELGLQPAAGEGPEIFRRMAKAAGLDTAGVSGHSTRVGAAQDMIALGLELPEIMQAGGWKSPAMPARYGDRLLARRGAPAKLAQAQGRA